MGKAGAARVKSGDLAYATAMQGHEDRVDYVGARRRVRDVPPLVYSPYATLEAPDPDAESRTRRARKDRIMRLERFIHAKPEDSNFSIWDSLQAHITGARKSKAAKKDFLHAFLQYPTDLELNGDRERLMLRQAVEFINLTYGGNAVFHARLDRDEAGRHGVDVFFAPRYEKKTQKGTTQWISLSKFSKENARQRYGQREKRKRDPKTGEMIPVLGKDGQPVMVWNDSGKFQGRALQDAWHEHLLESVNIKWAERGKQKQSDDPDRLSPEAYAAHQEEKKLKAEVERQLDNRLPQDRDDSTRAEAAAKLIEQAGERAYEEARASSEHIMEAARTNAQAVTDRLVSGAVKDAEAITKSMLSTDAEEFARLRAENAALQTEVLRQGRMIKLLSKALRAVLPESLRLKVKLVFEREWSQLSGRHGTPPDSAQDVLDARDIHKSSL